MYKIGDTVVYGANGVCEIRDIREEKFAGQSAMYYILSSENSQTIYVPVENEALTAKMKRLLSKGEALEFVRSFPKIKPVEWVNEGRKRNELFKSIILDADRESLVGVIKAIYEKRMESASQGRKLYLADENAFKRAERMLYGELSVAFGIPYDEVAPFIEKELDA